MRTLQHTSYDVVGLDIVDSPFTSALGSIADRSHVRQCMAGVDAVLHTATLHKPHVITHSRQDFVDTNITGTLTLLEEAASVGVGAFVFTSTTSAFGMALMPPAGAPAAWVTEDVRPVPRNIYGVTKAAAEDLCELFHRSHRLACLVLRTSRFFPEEDDDPETRRAYDDGNVKGVSKAVKDLLEEKSYLKAPSGTSTSPAAGAARSSCSFFPARTARAPRAWPSASAPISRAARS